MCVCNYYIDILSFFILVLYKGINSLISLTCMPIILFQVKELGLAVYNCSCLASDLVKIFEVSSKNSAYFLYFSSNVNCKDYHVRLIVRKFLYSYFFKCVSILCF
jgi:hypothetical protein